MGIIDAIRARQTLIGDMPPLPPPFHRPEVLYIGCVDARLDPIDDIGIPKGKALIFRNISALVLKDDRANSELSSETVEAILAGGEIPQNVGIGAALEFFLNHISLDAGKMKHIIVSGHTDCGGIKACYHGEYKKDDYYLRLYLDSLKETRARILEEAKAKGWDAAQILQELEYESVRQSVANLRTYPVVQKMLDAGGLEIHGWKMDTATQRIYEMNLETLDFVPMVPWPISEDKSSAQKTA